MNFILRQQDYENPNSLASRFRRARAKHIVGLIQTTFVERGACRIVDLGGRPGILAIRPSIGVFFEARQVRASPWSIERTKRHSVIPMFVQRSGDARALDAPDNGFDVAHSTR